MRNIDIFEEDGTVVIVLNGERTVLTSCKKFNNFEVMGKFANSYSIQHMHIKEDITAEYVKAGDLFGCSVAAVKRMLNGAINRVFIDANYALMKRFGYHKGRFDYERGDTVITRKAFIQQYIDDGNDHLAGFGLLWDDTSSAKKACGKGLWKSLCKNSKSRNDMITKHTIPSHPNNYVALCKFLQAIPSSLLKFGDIINYYQLGPNFAKEIVKSLGMPMCKARPGDVMRIGNIANDCKRMVGDRFNPNWTLTRMRREHEKETKRIRDIQHTDDNFPYYDLLPHTIEVPEHSDHIATLIRSPRQLVELGDDQHHCVGSYSNGCWNGQYVVYKITNKEGLVSTLGFGVGNSLMHSQHYMACNALVKDELRTAFGTHVKKRTERAVTRMVSKGKWVETTVAPAQQTLLQEAPAGVNRQAPYAAPPIPIAVPVDHILNIP